MPEPETTRSHAVTLRLPRWLARAMASLPFAPLQPALALMLAGIGRTHPALHDRPGVHVDIDSTDLPFASVMEPKPRNPRTRAVRGFTGQTRRQRPRRTALNRSEGKGVGHERRPGQAGPSYL